MNLLAIETSTDACSIALSVGDDLLQDHRIAAQKQATLVLPMADALLAQAGLTPQQLDGVVFGRGPGSFTGVRIGVAVSQGIALGAGVGVAGISTLQSVAQGCHRVHGDRHLAVSLDARMDEIYLAGFALDDSGLMQAVSEEVVTAPEAMQSLPDQCRQVWAGSGAERYAPLLAEQLSGACVRAECRPMAQDLLTLGHARILSDGLLPAEQAMPVYLRDKVAQTTAEREARA